MTFEEPFLHEAPPPYQEGILDEITMEGLMAFQTTAQAEEQLAGMTTDEKLHYTGKRMIGRYGCFACHNIKGFEDAKRIGTELSEWGSKPIHQLDFALLHDIPHKREAWLMAKLRNTRIFDHGKEKKPEEKLKMPLFNLTDYDREAIVSALIGMVKDKISPAIRDIPNAREAAIEKGRRLVKENNCQGCHQVENWGGAIQATLENAADYPPWLEGEGKKVQMEWLFEFLHQPYIVRPWLETRMPSFEFTTEQINQLIAYFSHISDEPYPFDAPWPVDPPQEVLEAGRFLLTAAGCVKCHKGLTPEVQDKSSLAPNLELAHERLKSDWILQWLRDPASIQPDTKMPNFWEYEYWGDDPTYPTVFEGDAAKQIWAVAEYLKRHGTVEDEQIALRDEDYFSTVGDVEIPEFAITETPE